MTDCAGIYNAKHLFKLLMRRHADLLQLINNARWYVGRYPYNNWQDAWEMQIVTSVVAVSLAFYCLIDLIAGIFVCWSISIYFSALKRQYAELHAKMEALTTSSSDTLLTKICNLASRSAANFSRFEAMDLREAIKNTAQDNKHERANYYWIIAKMLSFSKLSFCPYWVIKINKRSWMSLIKLKRLIGDAKRDRIHEGSSSTISIYSLLLLPTIWAYEKHVYKLKRDQAQSNITMQNNTK
jgi:low affinity Fe/Cu permease